MAGVRRELGNAEKCWFLALKAGTGISVSGILFSQSLSGFLVQVAVNELIRSHPLLGSHFVVGEKGKVFLENSDKPVLVDVVDRGTSTAGAGHNDEEGELAQATWLKIVEEEMNTPFPEQNAIPCFQVRLYNNVSDDESLLILRAHPAACDFTSLLEVRSLVLQLLQSVMKREEGTVIADLLEKTKLTNEKTQDFQFSPSIENIIPKGAANKPFWAHGVDVVGYGLVSRRHAYVPFQDATKPRRSRILQASISLHATKMLVQGCKDNNTTLYGALTAAGLKATATFKNVRSKGEHYCVVVMLNCRDRLDPVLPPTHLGAYHSVLMKTYHASDQVPFWKLAAQCSSELADAIKNNKHFTDMGDLNMLMTQAIYHPNLTPSSSMRTALLSIPSEVVTEDLGEAGKYLQVKDFVATSSCSGVGPCLAVFPYFRDGALMIGFTYCSPLFSQKVIRTLIDSIILYLTG